ncbi:MAG: FAD-dependent oxidoreductase, partial [Dehalococcoidia bacterium]|nr:FAD-dependent oxidoreductase [Dehalococcoidia bacterium]
KLHGLLLAVSVYYDAVALLLVGAAAAAAIWAYRRRILHFHPAGWFILVVGALVYIAMPRAIFSAHLADQRLPIALAFALIACFRVDFHALSVRRAFVGLVLALLAIRIAEVQLVWDRLGQVSEAFHRSVMLLKRGARVLVVHGDRSNGKEVSDFELMHAASLATIERSALLHSLGHAQTVVERRPARWIFANVKLTAEDDLELVTTDLDLTFLAREPAEVARRWGTLSPEERLAQAIENVEVIHPAVRQEFELGASKVWHQDEFAGGAYALFEPGQQTHLYRHIIAPEGRLHIAGEHASLAHGWVQGAVESGLRCVAEILDRAG